MKVARVYRCLSEPQMIAGMPKNVFYMVLCVGSSPLPIGTVFRAPLTMMTFLYPIVLILVLAFAVRMITKRNPFWWIDLLHARRYPRYLAPHLTAYSQRIRHTK